MQISAFRFHLSVSCTGLAWALPSTVTHGWKSLGQYMKIMNRRPLVHRTCSALRIAGVMMLTQSPSMNCRKLQMLGAKLRCVDSQKGLQPPTPVSVYTEAQNVFVDGGEPPEDWHCFAEWTVPALSTHLLACSNTGMDSALVMLPTASLACGKHTWKTAEAFMAKLAHYA